MFGEGNGTPLQYSCLENPMDGGVWWAVVQEVARSRTQLSDLVAAAAAAAAAAAYMFQGYSVCPALFFPHWVRKSALYVCISIPALQIGSSVPVLDKGAHSCYYYST